MKAKLEVIRINSDVIATSGMCQYINPSYAHWKFYDVTPVEGGKLARIDAWRYSQESGWTLSHEYEGDLTPVSGYEEIYSVTINDGDIYRVGTEAGTDPFTKCTGDHSYLFNLEEN